MGGGLKGGGGGGLWSEEEEGGEGREAACCVSLSDFLSVLCALKPAAAGKCSRQSQQDVGRKTRRQGDQKAELVTPYSQGSPLSAWHGLALRPKAPSPNLPSETGTLKDLSCPQNLN